ncbi:uncharacterized protein PV07_03275 [Cladophialophora immunda]|uniref:Transcription factor domain-containing protein n=1 Tax=Cladophialophora immunda TaxID=569365 RepID=A0A0D2CKF0_9EURO|nr:uncharacterized protein PV07_03275 [Cladophialophora immunda]KIW31663.1 hypothetical protein PV07_03275 [Cladophialophora immunda]OQV09267.1 Fungal specific transcription factor domain-containing protein [Cladophialophora immunda]
MAEEAVIFPSQPLFMVDRGWQRRKKKAKNDALFQELDLQTSRVPEVTIRVANGQAKTRSKSPPQARLGDTQAKVNPRESGQIQFMAYKPSERKQRQPAKSKKTDQIKRTEKQVADTKVKLHIPPTELAEARKDVSFLKQTLPGTATALYTVIDPEVSSFQKFMTYYPTRLAASMYPISRKVRLTYNPIETIWLPAVVTDEVSLHTILFSCATHFFVGSGHQTFKDSHLLMKVILNRLNRRIHDGKYSDLTIGAVSCLALNENHMGNHQKWEMHAAGMSEMVRARGGFGAVRDVLHMKIYRADTIGAVDTLSHPHFPRPVRKTQSLYSAMVLQSDLTPIDPPMLDPDLTLPVSNALAELTYLCHVLNHAADMQTPIDPLAFDEDVTCIQHDLLRSQNPKQGFVERVCVIAALIFIQTLTREVPFTRRCSGHLSRELKMACLAVEPEALSEELMFWVLFMGGLVSIETDQYIWFRARLVHSPSLRHGVFTWENVKCQLRKVFWIDSLQEDYGLGLWRSIDTSLHLPGDPITAWTDMDQSRFHQETY